MKNATSILIPHNSSCIIKAKVIFVHIHKVCDSLIIFFFQSIATFSFLPLTEGIILQCCFIYFLLTILAQSFSSLSCSPKMPQIQLKSHMYQRPTISIDLILFSRDLLWQGYLSVGLVFLRLTLLLFHQHPCVQAATFFLLSSSTKTNYQSFSSFFSFSYLCKTWAFVCLSWVFLGQCPRRPELCSGRWSVLQQQNRSNYSGRPLWLPLGRECTTEKWGFIKNKEDKHQTVWGGTHTKVLPVMSQINCTIIFGHDILNKCHRIYDSNVSDISAWICCHHL